MNLARSLGDSMSRASRKIDFSVRNCDFIDEVLTLTVDNNLTSSLGLLVQFASQPRSRESPIPLNRTCGNPQRLCSLLNTQPSEVSQFDQFGQFRLIRGKFGQCRIKIKQLVNAKLIARLQLAPEQASQLRELLREKQRPATDFMTALMAGDFEESQIPEAGARVQQQIKDADAQIKALLGAEGYAYLDSEEKTDVERHQLRDMKSQFADGGHPLRPEQIEPLLAAMYDERQNFKFSVNFHEPASFDYTHFTDIFSEQNLERFYTESQQLNARIVTRVQGVLDPEQVVEFERAIQERLERGHATVRMTQTLFPIKKRP